jgi:hypothetical protein
LTAWGERDTREKERVEKRKSEGTERSDAEDLPRCPLKYVSSPFPSPLSFPHTLSLLLSLARRINCHSSHLFPEERERKEKHKT